MGLAEWARHEIDIACGQKDGFINPEMGDYDRMCCESAYKAFTSLVEDGHSGMSIGITKHILDRLIDGKPLTPILDIPEEWHECGKYEYEKDYTNYQCNRMSSLFKKVYTDGTVRYNDINRCVCVNARDQDCASWYNGFVSKIIDEIYPITMPYMPPMNSYTVYCAEDLYDPKNGDFDTLGILWVKQPNGECKRIKRYFKEDESEGCCSWKEISEKEYWARVRSKGDIDNG